MFRRLKPSLPADANFSSSMKDLGYNMSFDGLIRAIDDPSQGFVYNVTNNDRYNEVRREAMHRAVLKEIGKRMKSFGAPKLYLPQMTTTRPEGRQSLQGRAVPIFATPKETLQAKKRVLLVINSNNHELGCWAFRSIFDAGINYGSTVNLARYAQDNDMGLLVLNTGSLLYSFALGRAVTISSWRDRSRPSICHMVHGVRPEFNLIPSNETPLAHVQFVLKNIIEQPEYVAPEASIDIIAIQDGGNAIVEYLNDDVNIHHRVGAIALISPWFQNDKVSPALAKLLRYRSRTWELSDSELNTVLRATTDESRSWDTMHSPVLSSGVTYLNEMIFPTTWKTVMDWFEEVDEAGEKYHNPPMAPLNKDEEKIREAPEMVEVEGMMVPKVMAEKLDLL